MKYTPVAVLAFAASSFFASLAPNSLATVDATIVASTDGNAPSATDNPRELDFGPANENIVDAGIFGPEAKLPSLMTGFEPWYNPDFQRLREENKLDDVIRGEKDDFTRILKLRHWVHTTMKTDLESRLPYYDAFAILEAAKKGAGVYCAHYQVVSNAVYSAYGIPTRMMYIDVDYKKMPEGRHHAVNEVWCNSLAKWIAVDAMYDIHFVRDGVPLSALEIHEAVRARHTEGGQDGGKGIVMAMGLERTQPPHDKDWDGRIDSYFWVGYWLRSDYFTQPHWYLNNDCSSRFIIYDTPAVRASVWPRYEKDKNLIYESDRNQINWTPNTPKLFSIHPRRDGSLSLRVLSATPNFKEYRVRIDGKAWEKMPEAYGYYQWHTHAG